MSRFLRVKSVYRDYLQRRHFVPNLTLGPPIVKALRKHLPDAFLDCHLMVTNPEQWIPDFAKAGASGVTVHIETARGSFFLRSSPTFLS
jgi:pentose-5-phosphate-3-epimerase